MHVALNRLNRIECNYDDEVRENQNCGSPWEASNNVGHRCDSCFWDQEVILFCNLLNKYLVN